MAPPTRHSTKQQDEGELQAKRLTEVDRFARAFKDENHLRNSIATLLRQMKRDEVRITHGPSERGKDIVFYAQSGLGEKSLFACVVKNERIVGDVASRLCAQAVFHQAEQAFNEPYINPSNGRPEIVKGVYVMSPQEPSQAAIESIRTKLAHTGTVEFFCGSRLLDLFSEHWRSFLQFESNVMVSYLSALRTGLQRDTALIELFLRRSILTEVPSEFESMYVPQGFGQSMCVSQVSPRLRARLQIPSPQATRTSLREFESRVRELMAVVSYLVASGELHDTWDADPILLLEGLLSNLQVDWDLAYRSYVSELLREHRTLAKEMGSRRRLGQPAQIPSERTAVLDIQISSTTQSMLDEAERLRQLAASILERDCAIVNIAPPLRATECDSALDSPQFASFCRLQNLQEDAPGSIVFDNARIIWPVAVSSGFLDCGTKIVLLVGPAGFGKTSFCKWQALSSASRLLSGEGDVLPVFVPLHKFAYSVPADVNEAFFDSLELRTLLSDAKRKTSIRLFLDGLDEIPDPQRQRSIVALARSVATRFTDCQIVLTARDHVFGSWLDGIPRLKVEPLSEMQQRTLAENWLGKGAPTDAFFRQLALHAQLRPLMEVPLLATLTIAVFKKNQDLPSNRTGLYSLFVELLCGGWDAVKGTNRGANFGIRDKQMVLKSLAGMNHLAGRRDASISNFRAAVRASLSGFIDQSEDLISEMLQDGLIVSTGAGVRFSHLSFQEFMAAEYLTDPSGERAKVALARFFSGDDWWKEVLIFHVTNTANPAEMEEWLVKRAKAFAQKADSDTVISGKLDERLTLLRKGIADAFPKYQSRYPENGIVSFSQQGGSRILNRRRSLSGVWVDD